MLTGLMARARSLWRGVHRGDALHAEMDEEFRLHQELRAADLVRQGVAPAEAARRARLEFGSTERYKHEGRASRGLRHFDSLRVSWLDVKLGVRMLVKYPGLTLVGGLAMAFAIWVGAGTFEFVTQVLRPTLPLPQGDRVVGIRNWDLAANRVDARALHDFVTWREELRTVREIGAFRTLERNMITADGQAEPVEVAEISPSAFALTRVRPLLGRTLVEADARDGAPPVAVIGHQLWQRRFAGDSAVVGRTVRLGTTYATVVGVMPEDFAFPIAQSLWVPLQLDVLSFERGQSPGIQVFGRLAPGATLDEARTELAALGQRASADFPRTHEHLRPQVLPYAQSILGFSGTESLVIGSSNVFLVMLLVLVCGNVALLMFARMATRESEIVVRNALGASRGRIIGQLFVEALVLGGVAAAVGLAGVSFGLRWGMSIVEAEMLDGGRLPFWFVDRLSPTTVLYVALLTVLGAVITGVVPALKATRGLQARLRAAGAGDGLQFGGIWTAVIVSQVAVTVAFPVTAIEVRRDIEQIRSMEVAFPSERFLSVQLQMDRASTDDAPADTSRAAFLARFRAARLELERRLLADPAVAGVTFADRLPRGYHPHRIIELDEGGGAPLNPNWPNGYRVSSASVEPDYFEVLGTPILQGRAFHSGDLAEGATGVIVNQSFVDNVLGGRSPLGRRLRYVYQEEWEEPKPAAERGPWYEIVGVVPDLGFSHSTFDPKFAGFYHPLAPDAAHPVQMAVHVRSGDPAALAPQVRSLAAATDPTLRLDQLVPIDDLSAGELRFLDFWFRLTVLLSLMAIVLSLAGIYAVMSFTVARRPREIGIRVALGSDRRRILASIFRRPLTQVGLGVLAGAGLIGALLLAAAGSISPKAAAMLVGYSVFMLGVCLLACIVPTRRALRVEPTEALRAEG